jgi:hypothetical protein
MFNVQGVSIMYILIKVGDDGLLAKVRKYLAKLGVWIKEFKDPVYRVDVSVEEREEVIRANRCEGDLNPPAAWSTCASFVQAWDWDSLGRGPARVLHGDKSKAPRGKGWGTLPNGNKMQVAGECGNPSMLTYLSCPKWCDKYEPASMEAYIFVANAVMVEHERRANALKHHIASLQVTDMNYRQAVRTGGIFLYKGGKMNIVVKEDLEKRP